VGLLIREMRRNEERAWLEVHRAAVRQTASADYAPAVIEAWAPEPISDGDVRQVSANEDDEIRLVAELDGAIVGIGAVVLAMGELRACYVAPTAARSGVGAAIVREIERIAIRHGVTRLELDASLTAVPFYLALGYALIARREHMLSTGQLMESVRMEKSLS
jgi:putative acetyltransferase